jgi:hypothetical protein
MGGGLYVSLRQMARRIIVRFIFGVRLSRPAEANLPEPSHVNNLAGKS